jgi:hypothetical protein
MNKRQKPTTTPALIEQARKCTSAKDVIRTLFNVTRTPNGLDRKEAKKIFLKEGIPWPSMRGRIRKGKPVEKKVAGPKRAYRKRNSLPLPAPEKPKEVELSLTFGQEEQTAPERPRSTNMAAVAFCPACGCALYTPTIPKCPGCDRELDIEITTRTIYSITAK